MLLGLVLAGCVQSLVRVPPADPVVVTAVASIKTESEGLFAGLRGKVAPACDFATNAPAYAALEAKTSALTQRVATDPRDKTLQTAVDALGRAVAGAGKSHELASATSTDPSGACLAPAVIDLNADAIARATAAIAELQRQRGGL